MDIPLLHERAQALQAELGAIAAFLVVPSRESSKVIRDCTKHTDSLSIELRRAMNDFDKSLTNDKHKSL